MNKFREIHFAPDGQDFSFWVINEDNVVVDSQPFQYSVWRNKKLVHGIEVGEQPILMIDGTARPLNYTITEIKEATEHFPFWDTPEIDMFANRDK